MPADGVADGVPDALHPGRAASPATRVLVQGAGGGVATALIALARAAGSGARDEPRRDQAGSGRSSSARTRSFEPGARLPRAGRRGHGDGRRGDVGHSLKSLRPGGTRRRLGCDLRPEARRRRADPDLLPAAAGASARRWAPATSCAALAAMLDVTGTRPLVDRALPLDQARDGFAAMVDGDSSARSSSPAEPADSPGFARRVAGFAPVASLRAARGPIEATQRIHRDRLAAAIGSVPMRHRTRQTQTVGDGPMVNQPPRGGVGQSSSSSRRASQVANRSTAVSNSGWRSVNSWSRSASHAKVTSSSPRRLLELLDAAVGEVHQLPLSAEGARRAAACCSLPGAPRAVPTDGAADRGRRRTRRERLDRRRSSSGHTLSSVVRPRAHVGRLVLHPADLLEVRETRHLRLDLPRSGRG